MQFLIPLTLSLLGTTLAASCNADNCARAVTGTAHGQEQVETAKADCASFLATTVTPSATTVYTTVTITPGPVCETLGPRSGTIPIYADACSGAVRYSSACSCFGVTGSTVTASTPTVTITTTATASPTSTPSSCAGSTCDAGFSNCEENENCYCFSGATTTGFCGANAVCSTLAPCATDAECGGGLCAMGTCCVDDDSELPGVCLTATCENPSAKLRFAAMARRAKGATAAFR